MLKKFLGLLNPMNTEIFYINKLFKIIIININNNFIFITF